MGIPVRCLKCNTVIESKHLHDFVWCPCKNIFVDGGDHYLKFGGDALADNTAEIFHGGLWKSVLDYMNSFQEDVSEDTKECKK